MSQDTIGFAFAILELQIEAKGASWSICNLRQKVLCSPARLWELEPVRLIKLLPDDALRGREQ
ncbi:hypothetical protein ACP90_16995 [Labrenzia sp. CP4]|nr:hypothetical protein ACP90_16995 [Labrenzia sp. CP4]